MPHTRNRCQHKRKRERCGECTDWFNTGHAGVCNLEYADALGPEELKVLLQANCRARDAAFAIMAGVTTANTTDTDTHTDTDTDAGGGTQTQGGKRAKPRQQQQQQQRRQQRSARAGHSGRRLWPEIPQVGSLFSVLCLIPCFEPKLATSSP